MHKVNPGHADSRVWIGNNDDNNKNNDNDNNSNNN